MNKSLTRLHLPMAMVLAMAILHGSWEATDGKTHRQHIYHKTTSRHSLRAQHSSRSRAIPSHGFSHKDLKERSLGSFIGARSWPNQIKLGIYSFFYFCFSFSRFNGKKHLEQEDGRHGRDSGLQTLCVIEHPHDSFFLFIIIYHSWDLKGSFGIVCQPNELCQFSRFLSDAKLARKTQKAWTSPDKLRSRDRIINKLSNFSPLHA